MHIAGESLLNAGSAIVFYTIFSGRFLCEIGIEGLGKKVNFVEGLTLFLREAGGGGAAIDIAFGLGLIIIIFCLDRQLEVLKENIVQVTVTYHYNCVFGILCSRLGAI
jgi:NhaP-type Na+/H+ or K+/H+ antiporter